MLELKNVEIRYGEFVAIRSIDLSIADGEFFTFLGPSGCGKTTLLRAVAGFLTPAHGSIEENGTNIIPLRPEERDIGIVFQNYALFPHMSVFENVAFGLRVRRVARAQIADRVQRYLTLVGLAEHGRKKVSELSGGQQQRVAIARSLILEPKILLLDEPLSNLDAKLRITMRNEIKRLQREIGFTAVYVTHDQEEALSLSDRIAVFNHGSIEQVGTPDAIYRRPMTEFVCRFVGDSVQIPSRSFVRSEIVGVDRIAPESKVFARPEALTLLPVDGSDRKDYHFLGSLASVEYIGMVTKCLIDIGDANLVCTALAQSADRFRIGEKVRVGFNRADLMVFGGDS